MMFRILFISVTWGVKELMKTRIKSNNNYNIVFHLQRKYMYVCMNIYIINIHERDRKGNSVFSFCHMVDVPVWCLPPWVCIYYWYHVIIFLWKKLVKLLLVMNKTCLISLENKNGYSLNSEMKYNDIFHQNISIRLLKAFVQISNKL